GEVGGGVAVAGVAEGIHGVWPVRVIDDAGDVGDADVDRPQQLPGDAIRGGVGIHGGVAGGAIALGVSLRQRVEAPIQLAAGAEVLVRTGGIRIVRHDSGAGSVAAPVDAVL